MVNECLQMLNLDQYNSNYSSSTTTNNNNINLKEKSMINSNDNNSIIIQKNRRNRQSLSRSSLNNYDNQSIFNNNRSIFQRSNLSIIDSTVLNVYADNLLEGIKKLREFSKISSVVAIDTEFPGVIVKLHQEYIYSLEYNYSNVKLNNDLLKPIQIGFSFFDFSGKSLSGQSTVQFNFKWSSVTDLGNNESIDLLKRSGIDFLQLEKNGIDPDTFAELFMSTGLVLNEELTWVGFHCAHDWPYILKIITGWYEMPEKFGEFSTLLNIYFPKTVDLKTLVDKNHFQRCGLQELSAMLQVERHGIQHQAGSDSLLAGETYFKFLKNHCDDKIKDEYYNLIFGLNYCSDNGNNMSWQPAVTPDDNFENNSSAESARSSPFSGNGTPDEESNSNNEVSSSSSG